MSKVGMLVDLDYCVGCYACQSACNDYNKLGLGLTYLKQCNMKPEEVDGELYMYMSPIPLKLEQCAHCYQTEDVAPCQAICISRSLYVAPVDELLDKAKELGTKTQIFMPRPE